MSVAQETGIFSPKGRLPFNPSNDYVHMALSHATAHGGRWVDGWRSFEGQVDWNSVPIKNIGDFKGKAEVIPSEAADDEDVPLYMNYKATLDVDDAGSQILHMQLPLVPVDVMLGRHFDTRQNSFDVFWRPLMAYGIADPATVALAARYETTPQTFKDVLQLLNEDYKDHSDAPHFETASDIFKFYDLMQSTTEKVKPIEAIHFGVDAVVPTMQQLQDMHPEMRSSFERQNGLASNQSGIENLDLFSGMPRYDWRLCTVPMLLDNSGYRFQMMSNYQSGKLFRMLQHIKAAHG